MIHELREYRFSAENWVAYWDLFRKVCLPIRKADHGVLAGAWMEKRADDVRFLHLWEYNSLDHRAALRAELAAKPEWRDEFLAHAAPLIQSQYLSVLVPKRAVQLRNVAITECAQMLRFQCEVGKAGKLLDRIESIGSTNWATWSMEFPEPNAVVVFCPGATRSDAGALATGLADVEVRWIESLSP